MARCVEIAPSLRVGPDLSVPLMVRRRVSAVSNHEASSFETPLRGSLRMRRDAGDLF
jgi:hypothetical protein